METSGGAEAARPPLVSMQVPTRPAGSSPVSNSEVRPAASLSGIDRHLLHRPLDSLPASDFVIGPLADSATLQASELLLVSEIKQSLLQNQIPLANFPADLRVVVNLMYGQSLLQAPPILEVRVGQAVPSRGASKQLSIRLIGRTTRAKALLTIGPADGGWMAEHITLDDLALAEQYSPLKDFDPHGVLQ